MYLPILRMSASNKAGRKILPFARQVSAEKGEKIMPSITYDVLDDALNDECHGRDALTAIALALFNEHRPGCPNGPRKVTRRGDSIVPPTSTIEATFGTEGTNTPPVIGGVTPKKEGNYWVYEDVPLDKIDENEIPAWEFEIDTKAMASVHAFHREYYSASPPLPASHRSDPHTSKEAAASVTNVAHNHRVAILTALQLFGPATGHELAARLGLQYVQVAKRLTELAADGRINRREILAGRFDQQAGSIPPIYQTRPSPSGRQACVWHLNPLAKA